MLAVGSIDGEAASAMSAIASQLRRRLEDGAHDAGRDNSRA